MRTILMLIISLSLILTALPTWIEGQVRRAVQPALDINWTTTRLGTIPKNYDKTVSILFSPNGRRVAAIVAGPDGCFVIDGDSEREIYCLSASGPGSHLHIFGAPIFSPDGRKLAYVARKGEKLSAVLNGKEGKLYDEIEPVIFSPDSQKLAYVAREGKKRFVVLDDKEGTYYEWIDISGGCSDPVFSADSQKLAFIARKDGKDIVVIADKDGEKQRKPYDWIHCITFSPDSQRIIYDAKQGGQRWGGAGKQFVVTGDSAGDHEGKQYDLIMGPPILTDDGQELAYIAVDGGKYFVVVGDRAGKKYDQIRSIAFLPGKREVVYVGERDKRSFLVVGEKESKPYEGIWLFALSPDGKKIMYVVQEDVKQITAGSWSVGTEFIVVGEKEGKRYASVAPYREPHGPVFSPDSQKFAYVATRERRLKKFFVVLGDGESKEYEGIHSLVFSPDSKVLAYVAQKTSKQLVVIGDKEGKSFDEVVTDPIFSPDSKKVAYGARLGNDLWWIVEEVQ